MIWFGVNREYAFEGPYTLGGWTPPAQQGLFAIMYRQNEAVERYAVIFVGESGDLSREGFPFRHPRAPCWLQRCSSRWKLSVAYLLVPGGSPPIRRAMVERMIELYDPVCNDPVRPPA